jgi:glyoxylase-like metal-dependent hydrolase (beta-lactamase superfamily II)
MVYVDRLECGPVATNAWVVSNTSTHLGFVVDAPPQSLQRILTTLELRGCKLTDVLLTHSHWDHTVDCAALARITGARVSVHADDVYRLLEPNRHTVWPLPFHIDAVTPNTVFTEDVRITAAGIGLNVTHTPGHTEGGVCFVDEVNRWVFVGDTLFSGSIGRTDLPGGNMEVLLDSIRTSLLSLPDDFVVYPGHGPQTTIADERATNPFLIA